jgi:hypothetical protein
MSTRAIACTLLVSLLSAAAVVGSGAMSAGATTLDGNGAVTVNPSQSLATTVKTSRVALTDGRVTVGPRTKWMSNPGDIATDEKGEFVTSREDRTTVGVPESTVSYRISMLNAKTDFWLVLKTQLKYFSDAYNPQDNTLTCSVFAGDPNAGGTKASVSPFNCDTSWASKTDVAVTVSLNRWTEASGAIVTKDSVSLSHGTFKTDAPYHIDGDPSLGPGSKTTFDAVLREGDTSWFADQARTEFSYQVETGDPAKKLWVAGMSMNHRGRMYTGNGRCAFYDHNPFDGEHHLDDSKPLLESTTGYTCKAEGYIDREGTWTYRGHWHTDFTIARD